MSPQKIEQALPVLCRHPAYSAAFRTRDHFTVIFNVYYSRPPALPALFLKLRQTHHSPMVPFASHPFRCTIKAG